MMETIPQDPGTPMADAPGAPPPSTYRIQRIGARPLTVQGTELGMAMSFTPACPYWYEINILRTVEQGFVLVIKHFFQSEQEQNTVQAWEFQSFADLMDKLETYDAANDVRFSVDPEDTSLSVPELAAWAMDLRARALAARAHFGGLVGELLHEIEFGG